MSKIPISEIMSNPENLNHDGYWSFFDWFCTEKSLERRAKAIIPKLKFLVDQGILNVNKTYLWLKNNCPLYGDLYDDIRISTLNEENAYLGGFCPRTGHKGVINKCSVWHFNGPNGEMVTYDFNNWLEFKKEVKTNKEFKNELIKSFNII